MVPNTGGKAAVVTSVAEAGSDGHFLVTGYAPGEAFVFR
jgi:hypothetical protein